MIEILQWHRKREEIALQTTKITDNKTKIEESKFILYGSQPNMETSSNNSTETKTKLISFGIKS